MTAKFIPVSDSIVACSEWWHFVDTVEVRLVAGAVPPASLVIQRAVGSMLDIIILIFSGELHTFL